MVSLKRGIKIKAIVSLDFKFNIFLGPAAILVASVVASHLVQYNALQHFGTVKLQ